MANLLVDRANSLEQPAGIRHVFDLDGRKRMVVEPLAQKTVGRTWIVGGLLHSNKMHGKV